MAGFPICTVICTLATGTWWRERDINVMEERLDGVQHWSIFINALGHYAVLKDVRVNLARGGNCNQKQHSRGDNS